MGHDVEDILQPCCDISMAWFKWGRKLTWQPIFSAIFNAVRKRGRIAMLGLHHCQFANGCRAWFGVSVMALIFTDAFWEIRLFFGTRNAWTKSRPRNGRCRPAPSSCRPSWLSEPFPANLPRLLQPHGRLRLQVSGNVVGTMPCFT